MDTQRPRPSAPVGKNHGPDQSSGGRRVSGSRGCRASALPSPRPEVPGGTWAVIALVADPGRASVKPAESRALRRVRSGRRHRVLDALQNPTGDESLGSHRSGRVGRSNDTTERRELGDAERPGWTPEPPLRRVGGPEHPTRIVDPSNGLLARAQRGKRITAGA